MRTLDDQLDRALFNERLLAMLASGFAGLAVLLAVVGVYGVMSFVVRIVRARLGFVSLSEPLADLPSGSSCGMRRRCWGTGVLVALPTVAILGQLIESQLFGVQPVDWPTICRRSDRRDRHHRRQCAAGRQSDRHQPD